MTKRFDFLHKKSVFSVISAQIRCFWSCWCCAAYLQRTKKAVIIFFSAERQESNSLFVLGLYLLDFCCFCFIVSVVHKDVDDINKWKQSFPTSVSVSSSCSPTECKKKKKKFLRRSIYLLFIAAVLGRCVSLVSACQCSCVCTWASKCLRTAAVAELLIYFIFIFFAKKQSWKFDAMMICKLVILYYSQLPPVANRSLLKSVEEELQQR